MSGSCYCKHVFARPVPSARPRTRKDAAVAVLVPGRSLSSSSTRCTVPQSFRIDCHCVRPPPPCYFFIIITPFASKPAVRELILRGCNPNTGSGTGETALHTMAAFGHVDCAKTLKALCGNELILQPEDKVRRSLTVPPPCRSRSPRAALTLPREKRFQFFFQIGSCFCRCWLPSFFPSSLHSGNAICSNALAAIQERA